MNTRDKAERFMEVFTEHYSKNFFRHMDEEQKGIGLIMRMLCNADGEVLAGDIGRALDMSTPRVAAALRVLESKGFVKRASAAGDARKVVVTITDEGRAEHNMREKALFDMLEYIISEVGESEWDEFVRLTEVVRTTFERYGQRF